MSSNMDGIEFIRSGKSLVVDSPYSEYQLEFNKSELYFANDSAYVRFITETERMVRNDKRYANYRKNLIDRVKLNHCQVLSEIDFVDEDGKAKDMIEMHHGPIFTLYDVCAIVLQYFIKKDFDITTMSVADAVLTEHEKNRVQVVMLCQTVHEMVHNGDIFLNVEQGYGKLSEFLKKYKDVFPDEIKEKYNRYMDRSLLYKSNDFDNLELNKKIFKL